MQPLLLLLFTFFGQTLHVPADVPLEYEYTQPSGVQEFSPIQVVIDFETEKKGKRIDKESGSYSLVFAEESYAVATKSGDSEVQLIVDFEGKTMTTCTSDKAGKVSAVKLPLIRMNKKMFENLTQSVQKTDEVRKILNYDCRKYIITSDDAVTESWIANVPGFTWGDLAEQMLGGNQSGPNSPLTYIKDMPNAFALESHSTLKGGKKVVHSYVKKLAVGDDADLSMLSIPANASIQDMTSLMKF